MSTTMRVLASLRALAALLLLLSVSSENTDQCENGADNCNLWTQTSPDTDGVVTYEQLKDMMSTGSVQLFDVREPDELEEGFIPGATNIPLGEVAQALKLSPDQFRQRYGVTKPQKDDSNFVLYCQTGICGQTVLKTVRALGYTRARHYAGGFSEWMELEVVEDPEEET